MSYKPRYDKKHRALKKGEYQRFDGRYTYRWTDSNGTRRCIYANDLVALRAKEDIIELNRLEGIKDPPSNLTVEKLYEAWISLKRNIKPSTRSGYIRTFDSIRDDFGKKLVVRVKRSHVKAFYIRLVEERGYAITTVENVHTVLHQVFQFAVDDDLLRKNPCDRVLKELKNAYADRRTKRKSLTLQQEINFLTFIHENPRFRQWYPTFFVMANTGLRVGELTGLRWKDIDFTNGFIDVNHNLVYFNHMDGKGVYYSVYTPKTENGMRKVVMTQAVIDAFLMQQEYLELAGIKSKDKIDGYDDFIFVSIRGHVQNQGALNATLARIIKAYNTMLEKTGNDNDEDKLPHFTCHVLRHTYATRLIESGANIKYVQYTMGHSEIQTTMDTYVTVTDDFRQAENQAFERYMDSAISYRIVGRN